MRSLNFLVDTVLVDLECVTKGGKTEVATLPSCMRQIAAGEQAAVHGDPQGHRDAEMFSVYAMGKPCPVLIMEKE